MHTRVIFLNTCEWERTKFVTQRKLFFVVFHVQSEGNFQLHPPRPGVTWRHSLHLSTNSSILLGPVWRGDIHLTSADTALSSILLGPVWRGGHSPHLSTNREPKTYRQQCADFPTFPRVAPTITGDWTRYVTKRRSFHIFLSIKPSVFARKKTQTKMFQNTLLN